MKAYILILASILMVSCNDSGGGSSNLATASPSESSTLEGIVDEVINSGELDQVTSVLESENHITSIREYPTFASIIDVQKTNVFNINAQAISYLFVNHRLNGVLEHKSI